MKSEDKYVVCNPEKGVLTIQRPGECLCQMSLPAYDWQPDAGKIKEDAQRIADSLNGCSGLNPAGYRACLDALKKTVDCLKEMGNDKDGLNPLDYCWCPDGVDSIGDIINQAIAIALAETPAK